MPNPPSKLDKQLADFLRNRMKRDGLSYPQMGKIAGTSGPTIHRLIHNQRSATLQMLAKITKGLGVELSEVFPDSFKTKR